jgi:hypothetical protein
MSTSATECARGFTLVETLVYLALYAIIMTGALTAVYSVYESSARNETIAMVEEEGEYLLGKIDWALADAASIDSPATTGSTLDLTLQDGSTVGFWNSGGNMRIQENGAPVQTLNNSNVAITMLQFTHTLSTGNGIDPERIEASFTIFATTSDGHLLTRDFSTTKYLRK